MPRDDPSPQPDQHSVSALNRWAAIVLFAGCLGVAVYVGQWGRATWTIERITLDVHPDAAGRQIFNRGTEHESVAAAKPLPQAALTPALIERLNREGGSPPVREELVYEETPSAAHDASADAGSQRTYYMLQVRRHWRFWSLLPAVCAIGLCWLTREPLISLLAGVVIGAMLLAEYDLTDAVLIPRLAAREASTVLVLYLLLLGGLMGVWTRTGASQAFADYMTSHFVRGPRSAKLVSWLLGVLFFQGGSVSAALVGSTVKRVADRQRVSHEELSYIVDSTASPIASLLAFNAWPLYVQSFIFVAGVPWLATEHDRIVFFFKAIPLCFYAWLAVGFTLLLSLEIMPFAGGRLKAAIRRSRTTGQLDAPDAKPLSAPELEISSVPPGYRSHVLEFILPLALLITVAVGSFIFLHKPKVTWAFGSAILLASLIAVARGMTLNQLVQGYMTGFKGASFGCVILLVALTIGAIGKETGGGVYLVELLGGQLPYWLLPVLLQALTLIIAFSTGTSWGTYAVTFPLAMPLAWAVAQSNGLEHPYLFMMVCFAAVMDGSVCGDQCSPISDTTVLSAMTTGCDLMDHVRTQLPQAMAAAAIAAGLWTAIAAFAVT